MEGDKLAGGGKSATFGPAEVTQEKWDSIWEVEDVVPAPVKKHKKKSSKESQENE
jgi:hypothetical protein